MSNKKKIEKQKLLIEKLEDRIYMDAAPVVDIVVEGQPLDGEALINENFDVTVSFDNQGSDAGFGPYVDVFFEEGVDTSSVTASAEGEDISILQITYDASGIPDITEHPHTGETIANDAGRANGTLLIAQLPFGSFAPDQPEITLNFEGLKIENDADLAGEDLEIQAQGGFFLGDEDGLDNPGVDPIVKSAFANGSITGEAYKIDKSTTLLEAEVVTGKNHEYSYFITVDIAAGQSLADLEITDSLHDGFVVTEVNLLSGTLEAGAQILLSGSAITFDDLADGSKDIFIDLGAEVGTSADDDVVIEVKGYIGEFTDETETTHVLDPSLGASVTLQNNLLVSGVHGANNLIEKTVDTVVTAKSIAIQKVANVLGPVHPGDVIEYTLSFQLSDYFGIGGILDLGSLLGKLEIIDHLGDGLEFDTSYSPLLNITSGSGLVPNIVNKVLTLGDHFTLDDTLLDGTTLININLRDALLEETLLNLIGFLVGNPDGDPTTGSITLRAIVKNDFEVTQGSAELSVDIGDLLCNHASISGSIVQNGLLGLLDLDILADIEIGDDSHACVSVGQIEVQKDVIDGDGNVISNPRVSIGNDVYFRLRLNLNDADMENLVVTDFLPIPMFDVTQIANASDVSVFETGAIPHVDANPDQIAINAFNMDFIFEPLDISVTTDVTNNSITIDFGSFNDGLDGESGNLDIIFKLTVQDEPADSRLLYNNQMEVTYQNSAEEEFSLTETAMLDFVPDLSITKGVIAVDNNDDDTEQFDSEIDVSGSVGPTGINWTNTGDTSGDTFSGGPFDAADFVAEPADANVENVDAHDTIRFAIVVTNTGSDPAYNLVIKDDLLGNDGSGEGFDLSSITNLGISMGDGSSIHPGNSGFFIGADGSEISNDNDFLEELLEDDGIRFVKDGGLGNNEVLVITFDVEIENDVQASSLLDNEVVITEFYAEDSDCFGEDGGSGSRSGSGSGSCDTDDIGENLADENNPISDNATALVGSPEIRKSVDKSTATIGEIVEYTVEIDFPEGETQGVNSDDPIIQDLITAGVITEAEEDRLDNQGSQFDNWIIIKDTLPEGMQFLNNTVEAYTGADNTANGDQLYKDIGFNNLAIMNGYDSFDDIVLFKTDPNDPKTVYLFIGDVTNFAENDGNAETLTIKYQAFVTNDFDSNNVQDAADGDTLANAAMITWGDEGQFTDMASVDVDVVEPELEISKSVDITSGDAGDTVEYTLTINHTGNSTSDAFELNVIDTLPDELDNLTLVSAQIDGMNVPGSVVISVAGDQLIVTNNDDLDLALGEELVIVFTAELNQDVEPDDIVKNKAFVTWTSIDGVPQDETPEVECLTTTPTGTDLGATSFIGHALGDDGESDQVCTVIEYTREERTGNHTDMDNPVNDYVAMSNEVDVTVPGVTVEKTIIDTSADHTGPSADPHIEEEVTIGEIITYELAITLPESTLIADLGDGDLDGFVYSMILEDMLPTGLDFAIQDVVIDLSMFTGTVEDSGGSAYSNGDSIISDDRDFSGDTLKIGLGTIITDDNNNVNDNVIKLQYTVVVENIDENQGEANEVQTELTNEARFLYSDPNSDDSDDRTEFIDVVDEPTVIVVEPRLQIDKTINTPDGANVGNPIDFVLAINHTGNSLADAFDLIITDDLTNTGIDLDETITFTAIISEMGESDIDVSSEFSIIGDELVVTGNVDLELAQTLTITISGVIDDEANIGEEFCNTGHVEWTSLDDTGTDMFQTDNIETQGDYFEERSGNDTQANDYFDSDEDCFEIDDFDEVLKEIINTSEDHTGTEIADMNLEDLAIGEEVTYRLSFEIPEGSINDILIEDILPNGLGYVSGSAMLAFVSTGDNITSSEGFVGAHVAGNSPSIITNNDGTAIIPNVNAQTLTFELGDLTNSENDGDNEYIVITFRAIVLDDFNNEGIGNNLTEHDNCFRIYQDTNDDGEGEQDEEVGKSNVVTIEVVEPDLDIDKDLVGPVVNNDVKNTGDAGDIFTYQITIDHTDDSNADAFNLVIQDMLPEHLEFVQLTGNTSAGVMTTNIDGDTMLEFTVDTLELDGDPIVIEFEVRLQDTVHKEAGDLVNSDLELEYESLPDADNGSDGEDREYLVDFEDLANENDFDDIELPEAIVPDLQYELEKTIIATSAPSTDSSEGTDVNIEDLAIGETVTFEIVVTFAEGTTFDVFIDDVLEVSSQTELEIDINSFNFMTGANLTVPEMDILLNSDLDAFFIYLGDVVNSNGANMGTPDADDQLTITFDAIVIDDPENEGIDPNVDVDSNSAFLRSLAEDDDDGTDFLDYEEAQSYLIGEAIDNNLCELADDDVDYEIVEPDLLIDKDLVGPVVNNDVKNTGDAGDIFTYQITIDHSDDSNADAFNLVIQDMLPEHLEFVQLTGNTSAGVMTTNIDGDTMLEFTVDTLELDGDPIVIEFEVRLQDTIHKEAGDLINSKLTLEYESLPDSDTGQNGEIDGEDREYLVDFEVLVDEDDGDDIELPEAIVPDLNYEVEKTIIGSSNPTTGTADGTDVNIEDLSIGETVTFEILVTFAEGTSFDVFIQDTLEQLGTTELEIDMASFAYNIGANLNVPTTELFLNGDLDAFFIYFGDIVNTNGDNMGTPGPDDQLTITFDAVVINDNANIDGDVDKNMAELKSLAENKDLGQLDSFTEVNIILAVEDQNSNLCDLADDMVDYEIVEPLLEIVKTVDTNDLDEDMVPQNMEDDEEAEMNQPITYTLTITNNGTASAHDISITDMLPTDFNYVANSLSFNTSDGDLALDMNNSAGELIDLTFTGDLDVGESFTITYQVIVTDEAQLGDMFINTATVNYDSHPGEVDEERDYDEEDTAKVTIVGPDLIVEKTGPESVEPGETFEYEITITNKDGEFATTGHNVKVIDNLPDSATFVGATITSDGPNQVEVEGVMAVEMDGMVMWTIPNIDPGETVTITIEVMVDEVAEVCEEILHNQVETIFLENNDDPSYVQVDPTPEDNSDSFVNMLDAAPDYGITITDNLTEILPGEPVTYFIEVTNQGNQDGADITVIQNFPTAFINIISASDGGIIDEPGGTITWEFATLNVGETILITVQATVLDSTPPGTILVNEVEVFDAPGLAAHLVPFDANMNGMIDGSEIQDFLENGIDVNNDGTINSEDLELYATCGEEDRNPDNNTDIDETEVIAPFAFSAFTDPNRVVELNLDFSTPIVPVSQMYTGTAAPGSTIVVEILDNEGQVIGSKTVMADAGGNWQAGFAAGTMMNNPEQIRVSQLQSSNTDTKLDVQDYGHTYASGNSGAEITFEGQEITTGGALADTAANDLKELYSAALSPVSAKWDREAFKFFNTEDL